MNLSKIYDERIICCNCGFAYKQEIMFIKQYNNTAICLCRQCAQELADEIKEEYEEAHK